MSISGLITHRSQAPTRQRRPCPAFVTLNADTDMTIEWTFGRELLLSGQQQLSGMGYVQIWPSDLDSGVVCTSLRTECPRGTLEPVSKRTVASARDHRSRRRSRTSAVTTSFGLPSPFGTRLGGAAGLPGVGRGSPFTESCLQVISFGAGGAVGDLPVDGASGAVTPAGRRPRRRERRHPEGCPAMIAELSTKLSEGLATCSAGGSWSVQGSGEVGERAEVVLA
jgi:hypothetical protein